MTVSGQGPGIPGRGMPSQCLSVMEGDREGRCPGEEGAVTAEPLTPWRPCRDSVHAVHHLKSVRTSWQDPQPLSLPISFLVPPCNVHVLDS